MLTYQIRNLLSTHTTWVRLYIHILCATIEHYMYIINIIIKLQVTRENYSGSFFIIILPHALCKTFEF